MPYKDPEKRKAYHRAYSKAHKGLWPSNSREKRLAASKDWKARNKDKVRAYRRKVDGLPLPTRTETSWCESCGRSLESAPYLDHCHLTGKFRGWLCNTCNRGIGLLGDDVASLEKALAYLKRAS